MRILKHEIRVCHWTDFEQLITGGGGSDALLHKRCSPNEGEPKPWASVYIYHLRPIMIAVLIHLLAVSLFPQSQTCASLKFKELSLQSGIVRYHSTINTTLSFK